MMMMMIDRDVSIFFGIIESHFFLLPPLTVASLPILAHFGCRNTIFRSQYILNHLNPLWDEFTLSLEELCYGDLNWPIKFTVYDYNNNGVHKEIGEFETTIQEMAQRVAIRGNADRTVAFELLKEDNDTNFAKTRGLVVVLKTEIQLHETSVAQTYPSFINNNSNNVATTNQNTWSTSQPPLPALHEV